MTREEIKNIVRHVFHFYDVNAENHNWADINEACGEILKALEQEPTNENLHREREQAYMQGYEDASKRFRQEPCEDAISKQEVLEAFEEWINDREDWNEHPVRFARSLVSLPSVTPTRKKGKWVAHHDESDDSHTIDCSCCGYTLVRIVNRNYTAKMALNSAKYMTKNYCPNCGAEMESEKNESGNS